MGEMSRDWYDADVATFGDRLAAARDAAGMDQETLARRLGVKLGTLRKWEDDFAEPRANRLQMMAGLLGVSITWLISGTGEGLPDLEAPGRSTDGHELLSELRELRTLFSQKAEQVGRMEKRLRRMLQDAELG